MSQDSDFAPQSYLYWESERKCIQIDKGTADNLRKETEIYEPKPLSTSY